MNKSNSPLSSVGHELRNKIADAGVEFTPRGPTALKSDPDPLCVLSATYRLIPFLYIRHLCASPDMQTRQFLRRRALPRSDQHWSLTALRDKLIKIGAEVVRDNNYVTVQIAEVAVPRELFAAILSGSNGSAYRHHLPARSSCIVGLTVTL